MSAYQVGCIFERAIYIYIDVKSQRNWSPKNVYYDALALAYMSCQIYIFNVQQQHHCTRSCQPPPYQCSLQEYVAQSFRTSITYNNVCRCIFYSSSLSYLMRLLVSNRDDSMLWTLTNMYVILYEHHDQYTAKMSYYHGNQGCACCTDIVVFMSATTFFFNIFSFFS